MFVGAAYDWPGVPNKLLTFRRHNRKNLNSKSTRDGGGSDMGDRLRRLAGGREDGAGVSHGAGPGRGAGPPPHAGAARPAPAARPHENTDPTPAGRSSAA